MFDVRCSYYRLHHLEYRILLFYMKINDRRSARHSTFNVSYLAYYYSLYLLLFHSATSNLTATSIAPIPYNYKNYNNYNYYNNNNNLTEHFSPKTTTVNFGYVRKLDEVGPLFLVHLRILGLMNYFLRRFDYVI